jgi:hypothetical protein
MICRHAAISRLPRIVITMYSGDHPPPHFHARYGGQQVSLGIDPLTVLAVIAAARD